MPLIFVVAGSIGSTLASAIALVYAYRKGHADGRKESADEISELQSWLLASILDAAAAKREES